MLRNSGPGRPSERYRELFLAAASFMEPRSPSFFGLQELVRELEKAYPELGKVVPSTLLRAFERFCDLPPRSPDPQDRVLYRIRVSHLLGHGYYAARHEVQLFREVVREIKEGTAYREGWILVDILSSPWRKAAPARCRGCGRLRDLEGHTFDGILCDAHRHRRASDAERLARATQASGLSWGEFLRSIPRLLETSHRTPIHRVMGLRA